MDEERRRRKAYGRAASNGLVSSRLRMASPGMSEHGLSLG